MITLQYYYLYGTLRGFDGNTKLFDCTADNLSTALKSLGALGLPPLSQWEKTDWGYELRGDFKFTPKSSVKRGKAK